MWPTQVMSAFLESTSFSNAFAVYPAFRSVMVVGEMAGMMRGEARGHGVSIRTDLNDDFP
jgi:hypothetical protein